MASKPIAAPRSVFESIKPIPNAQTKHTFFDANDYIPAEILAQIKNTAEAKEIGFFFYERKEKVIGVSIGSDTRLSKIYTISQDNIRRVWGKKLNKQKEQKVEQFFLYAEMKPPRRVETNPAAILPAPSAAID